MYTHDDSDDDDSGDDSDDDDDTQPLTDTLQRTERSLATLDDIIDDIITDENMSLHDKVERLLRARGTARDDVEYMLQKYTLRNGFPDYRAIYFVLITKQ
jgi:hypothetical protein